MVQDGRSAPRPRVPSGSRWPRISSGEIAAWRARRDADALAEKRPALKHPLKPLSWVGERERLEAAKRVASALEGAHAD